MDNKYFVCHLESEYEYSYIQTWVLVKATCYRQAEQIAYCIPWKDFQWYYRDMNYVPAVVQKAHFDKFDGDNNCEPFLLEGFLTIDKRLEIAMDNLKKYNEYEAIGHAVRAYGWTFVRDEKDED